MFRSISSISFSGQLEDKITAAAQAGFEGIEIFREDIIGFEGAPEEIGGFAKAAGVAIVSLQSLRDFEGFAGGARVEAFARAERFLDLAVRIGAPMLIVCANTHVAADSNGAVDDLRALAGMAADRGIKIGFEALATSAHIRTVREAYATVCAVDSPNFGLVIGAVHLFAVESGAMEALREIDPAKIALVHLADAPTTRIDAALLTQSFRLFPGQGALPVFALYAQLLTQGYTGPMSIEIFNDQIRTLPPSQIAADGMRAFHLLAVAQGHPMGAQAHSNVLEAGMIEFTAHGDEAMELAQLLGALGFVKSHQRGAIGAGISLWRQGNVTLAINSEEHGLAHSIYLLQGLSVSGVGLVVDDLPAMVDRIGLFHGETVEARNPYGLPVLRGPGGTVFYLQNGPLDLEGFTPQTVQNGGAITQIDHLAQAFQPNLFLSGMLFYRATFDLKSDEIRDVLDPHGTVHSRTLANADGRFRLSMNASFGAGTTTQRFLEKSGFAPFHHIAFATDDIFAVAAGLGGENALQVPANYYEDLALRFALPADVIGQLRAANVMYDRDAGGEYLQLYTRAINGLFFEVVERRGYFGMGAANAPVRMMAQLREMETEDALHLM